jgi:hypothetical protein
MFSVDPAYARMIDTAQTAVTKLHMLYDGVVEICRDMDIRQREWPYFDEVRRALAVRVVDADKALEALLAPLKKGFVRG